MGGVLLGNDAGERELLKMLILYCQWVHGGFPRECLL